MNRPVMACLVALAFVLTAPIGDAPAQQQRPTAAPTQAPTTTPLIAKALVRNETYLKVFDSGPRSPVVGGVKLAAKPTGPSKYVCANGSCICAGSFDCVKMIAADQKCDNTTVGCNDAGCVCTEK